MIGHHVVRHHDQGGPLEATLVHCASTIMLGVTIDGAANVDGATAIAEMVRARTSAGVTAGDRPHVGGAARTLSLR